MGDYELATYCLHELCFKKTNTATVTHTTSKRNIWAYSSGAKVAFFYGEQKTENSPIVCAVLALDSWNYCSGEQARQPNIRKIPESSLYSWTMYITEKNKVLPPYVNSLATRWHMLGIPLPLNQWSHARQTLRRRCWAVGPALQSNSSTCLVLILHRQLGNYLLSTGESYGLTAQHMQDWV